MSILHHTLNISKCCYQVPGSWKSWTSWPERWFCHWTQRPPRTTRFAWTYWLWSSWTPRTSRTPRATGTSSNIQQPLPPPIPASNTYSEKPALHLVALNMPFSGDIRADSQCFQQAQAAGLLSTYRAFLSSHLQDLSTIVRKSDSYSLPIVNLKGEILFYNWESIFSGHGGQFNNQVPIYSFDGRNVMTDPSWPQKVIWHGSNTNGIRLVSNYCEAWRTADIAVTGNASPLSTGKILDQKTYSCANKLIVLCIENSFMTDIRKWWLSTLLKKSSILLPKKWTLKYDLYWCIYCILIAHI